MLAFCLEVLKAEKETVLKLDHHHSFITVYGLIAIDSKNPSGIDRT